MEVSSCSSFSVQPPCSWEWGTDAIPREMVAFLFLNLAGFAGFVAVLFLSLGIVLPCPPICQLCSINTVECEEVSSLQNVLIALPSSTQQIFLRQGNLSEIPPLAFSNFTDLYFLSITGFLISSLGDLTFFTPYVNRLKILDLSNNHLLSCTVEPLAFSGLLYLEELILTNNSLDVLRRTWFLEMPGLNKLFLATNRITYLPPRTFENLNKLDELVVSSNMIQYLPMDAFFGLLSLTKLDLSSNNILFINQEAFQPLQALKYLLLFQNRLTTLPGLPDSIIFLFLHRNPWVCNCQLVHSMQLIQAKIQSPMGVTCKRPPFLAGHQVTSSKLLRCTSSPSSHLSSSLLSAIDFPFSNSGNVKLIYGLLGGFFLGLTVGLLCCYCIPKCCGCPPFANQSRNEKALSKTWAKPSASKEEMIPNRESQILSSLPIAESSATGFEVGNITRGNCCGQFGPAPQICYGEQVRFQNPLVAYLSMDAMGRSIVTMHEKGHEARCPVFGQSCYQAPQENTDRVTEVSGDGGNQEQLCTKCMHGLSDSCVLPTTMDQKERKQSGLGEQIDTPLNRQTLHPKIHLRDTQPLPALVHIDFPDGSAVKIEQNRATSCKSPSKRNESHQGRSHIQASPHWSRRKRDSHGQLHHPLQAGFASPGTSADSDVRHWQESWTGEKDHRRPDLHLSFIGNKSRRRKRLRSHPTHEVTSTPSLSSISTQSEANEFHYLTEPYPEWVSVTQSPGKRTRSSQYIDKTQPSGEMSLTRRKCRGRQEDPGVSFPRNGSTLSSILRCQNCGCEGFAPCSINQRRLAQPGVVSRSSRTFLDAGTQWSDQTTDAVRLKENEVALTFIGDPHKFAKTLSEERWLAACFPGFQRTSVIASCAGEIDSIYEYPSPQVSTTAFNTTSPLVERTTTEPILKHQDQLEDFLKVLEIKPMVVTEHHSVDLLLPNRMGFRSLSEEIQYPEDLTLEALSLGTEYPSEESEMDALTPSPIVSSFSSRTGTKPSLQELPITSCSRVTFSAMPGDITPNALSIMTICPLVEKLYQIDFPLLVDEEAKPVQGEEQDG